MSQINSGNQVITSDAEKAEAFNYNFTSIGQPLVSEITTVDSDPLFYVKHTDEVFSFEMIEVQKVIQLV